MHDNSFNPHFTDVETEPLGYSVACQVTELVGQGWDLHPVAWLWNPGVRSTDSLSVCAGQLTTGTSQLAGPTLLLFPTLPGLLMKLPHRHINTGTMSLILVAFRSQEPAGSCALRFMLPHPLELMGKVCTLNYEWWRGVTALSCPPDVFPAAPDLERHPL